MALFRFIFIVYLPHFHLRSVDGINISSISGIYNGQAIITHEKSATGVTLFSW
jgi:hypothetical protein